MVVGTMDHVCYLCGNPVDVTIKGRQPLSMEVDHILPLSKGGHPFDLSNLGITHKICNQIKGDKFLDHATEDKAASAIDTLYKIVEDDALWWLEDES